MRRGIPSCKLIILAFRFASVEEINNRQGDLVDKKADDAIRQINLYAVDSGWCIMFCQFFYNLSDG